MSKEQWGHGYYTGRSENNPCKKGDFLIRESENEPPFFDAWVVVEIRGTEYVKADHVDPVMLMCGSLATDYSKVIKWSDYVIADAAELLNAYFRALSRGFGMREPVAQIIKEQK